MKNPFPKVVNELAMNVERLKSKLTTAELVIGNVRDTVTNFFSQAARPPLAAIFNDLDYFSSSRDIAAHSRHRRYKFPAPPLHVSR
jgi:hypothetical protein